MLLRLLRAGDPSLQQALEARVEGLMRANGFGDVVEAWHGEIERVSAFRFDQPLNAS